MAVHPVKIINSRTVALMNISVIFPVYKEMTAKMDIKNGCMGIGFNSLSKQTRLSQKQFPVIPVWKYFVTHKYL